MEKWIGGIKMAKISPKNTWRNLINHNEHFPERAPVRNYICLNVHLPEITFP